MEENVLIGRGRQIVGIPREEWQKGLAGRLPHMEARLNFMTKDHHRLRNFVVMELPRVGKSLSPEFIARELNLPLARVGSILDDLEKHLTFVFRDGQGAVVWAYPVTVDRTPHPITFSTGEQLYAA